MSESAAQGPGLSGLHRTTRINVLVAVHADGARWERGEASWQLVSRTPGVPVLLAEMWDAGRMGGRWQARWLRDYMGSWTACGPLMERELIGYETRVDGWRRGVYLDECKYRGYGVWVPALTEAVCLAVLRKYGVTLPEE